MSSRLVYPLVIITFFIHYSNISNEILTNSFGVDDGFNETTNRNRRNGTETTTNLPPSWNIFWIMLCLFISVLLFAIIVWIVIILCAMTKNKLRGSGGSTDSTKDVHPAESESVSTSTVQKEMKGTSQSPKECDDTMKM